MAATGAFAFKIHVQQFVKSEVIITATLEMIAPLTEHSLAVSDRPATDNAVRQRTLLPEEPSPVESDSQLCRQLPAKRGSKERKEERELALRILAEYDSHQDRIAAWEQQTGKSRETFRKRYIEAAQAQQKGRARVEGLTRKKKKRTIAGIESDYCAEATLPKINKLKMPPEQKFRAELIIDYLRQVACTEGPDATKPRKQVHEELTELLQAFGESTPTLDSMQHTLRHLARCGLVTAVPVKKGGKKPCGYRLSKPAQQRYLSHDAQS